MESGKLGTAIQVLDTYGMVYAFTALFLVPGLFVIERLSIVTFSPAYLVLVAAPFLVGPAVVFALESDGRARTVVIRSAVFAGLVSLTGMTLIFFVMMVVMVPLSAFLVPANFGALTLVFSGIVVVLAMPLLVSLLRRVREGLSVAGVLIVAVLLAAIGVVTWMIVMTFDPGDTLGTFLSKDVVEHFIGAFTWYLPALAVSAGLWLRTGIV